MKKKNGLIMLCFGFILLVISIFKIVNNDQEKDENVEFNNKNQCIISLNDKKDSQILYELSNNKKISVDVLDCVEESTNEYGKIYSSENGEYNIQIRVWGADFQTLDSVVTYNYSILENSSSAYLTSDPFQTDAGVNYNLIQAFQVNEKNEILLMHHTIIYPIDSNMTASIEFSYNINELDIGYFKEVANSIKIID